MVFIVPPLFCTYCVCLSLLRVALLLTTNLVHRALCPNAAPFAGQAFNFTR